jgi:malate permease and related proteins
MEFIKPLSPVLSVFLLIASGFVFAHWKKINLASVTEIIVYLGTPSLVFSALAGKALVAEDILLLFVGSALIFSVVGILIVVYSVVFGFHSRGFALPILFMNAGNMGIPLALFAFGPAGMQRATLLYVLTAFLQYSLGIYMTTLDSSNVTLYGPPTLIHSSGFKGKSGVIPARSRHCEGHESRRQPLS